MYPIKSSRRLAPDIYRLEVQADHVATSVKPGQFVVLRLDEKGERFPLTVVDADPESGFIFLVVQAAGYSTKKLVNLSPGESILDLLGPLGEPTKIAKFGRVACLGGGVGTALVYPIAKACAAAGNEVVSFIGARTAKLVLLEDELDSVSNELVITTDDGSRGIQGYGADVLARRLQAGESFDRVFAIGPVPMMKSVSDVTRPADIETIVSLNPIMVDGTGMCGGCRVTVDGQVKFACMDGPEFDGHDVDFEELAARQQYFKDHEECYLQNL